ncbi:glutathione peroxidase [Rhizobium sp. L1K21]|uniref:glutathione peroxidase n=1 Tax=Rhizobium sp. L1K21 TaxID=2954933 RepID=UPI002092132A|nr:glutathione peroxidase [Rhizobium sp. L1K21]MCO6185454.1 glutathione peroxidase [Rhizobium sp. L1K21]
MSIYDFEAVDISGKPRKLAEFRGKIMLIVNTASACGFTPQYAGLETLYEKYKDDLVVLAFPCNQFGEQEKGDSAEIKDFCDLRFNVTFPLFEKIDVNGPEAHPLYQYLKKALPGLLGSQKIKWNFTKFLIDRDGKPVQRYGPPTKPEAIEKDIVALLG